MEKRFLTPFSCQLFTTVEKMGRGYTVLAYSVFLVLKDGKRQNVISGIRSRDQALFLEKRIERFLQIEDRPVEEETCA